MSQGWVNAFGDAQSVHPGHAGHVAQYLAAQNAEIQLRNAALADAALPLPMFEVLRTELLR